MLFRTRSILQLTIIGFLGVSLLLMVALFITARQLDELTRRSELAVSQSTEIMRAGRQLVEHTSAMERHARQYLVLGDRELLDVYAARRQEFLRTLESIRSMGDSHTFEDYADRLVATEEPAYRALQSSVEGNPDEVQYPPLLETAYSLSEATAGWVEGRVQSLREQTRETQQTLGVQTLLLVAAALSVAGVFIALIIRPLRRFATAIRRMGKGDYAQPVSVTGPRDLQRLGEQLDWLRGRLQQLEHQRHSFLRQVSHELKTPLAAMQESASLLSDPKVGGLNDRQHELLGILEKNGDRLLGLIHNLLHHHERSFAILESAPVPIDLPALVRLVLADHEAAIRNNRLTVDSRLEALTVTGDQDRMRVIVDNLLSNAVKYSPPGGVIGVSLYRERGRVVLDIRDQGPGIEPSEREAVFTPFFRGQSSTSGRYPGSGLGLAITREYVEMGGGTIESLYAEQGALFRVTLPLQEHTDAS